MNWIDKVTFYSKAEPLTETELENSKGFLAKPLTADEIVALEDLCSVIGEIAYKSWELPDYVLPNEYIDLLKYSRSGLLLNGEREFGYFGIEEIRDYYLRYMFPEYQPGAVPIGFNGGGVFYAYDLRNAELGTPIIATSSGVLDWGESVVLGSTLAEVFSKKQISKMKCSSGHNNAINSDVQKRRFALLLPAGYRCVYSGPSPSPEFNLSFDLDILVGSRQDADMQRLFLQPR